MLRKGLSLLAVLIALASVPVADARVPAAQRQSLNIVSFDNSPVRIVSQRTGRGKNWLETLAVEVENTSRKPIYYLSLHVDLWGTEKVFEDPVLIQLQWGAPHLSWVNSVASTSDAALAPGERVWLEVPAVSTRMIVGYLSQRGAVVTSAEVLPYLVGFGDGESWLIGRTVTQESNAALMRSAVEVSPNAVINPCGVTATDGTPSFCPCAPPGTLRWYIVPNQGLELLERRTCLYSPPLGGEPPPVFECRYDVVRYC